MNGITYLKSRYFTFRAVIHRPGPRLARNAIATNAGSATMCQLGAKRYHTMRPTSSTKLTRKSTNETTTAAVGTMRRGKYTLLMRFELPMRLAEDSDNAVEKNCQGSSPANTMSA